MQDFDVVVVGLGGMGSAAAAHLAARGARVFGVEQFERGHDRGASSGQSRLIRKAYFESPEYVPLLERAYVLWHELQAGYGKQLYFPTGLLTVGSSKSPALIGARAAAEQFDLKAELLDAAQIRKKYPALNPMPDEGAVFEADAGFVIPEATVEAHVQRAESHAAVLRFRLAMTSWDADAGGVTVALGAGERVRASRLVLTLGPWFSPTMRAVGVDLRIQRNVMAWFAPTRPLGPQEMPCFLFDGGTFPALLYGFPDVGSGVKAAFHGRGPDTTPQALDRDIDVARDITPIANALNDFAPGAAGTFVSGKACMYAMTSDEHFVIDRHPTHANVIIAGGFSGHGFKFVPVVGEIVAQLVLDGAAKLPIDFLSARRAVRGFGPRVE
jgi:sarcosine oxidase